MGGIDRLSRTDRSRQNPSQPQRVEQGYPSLEHCPASFSSCLCRLPGRVVFIQLEGGRADMENWIFLHYDTHDKLFYNYTTFPVCCVGS